MRCAPGRDCSYREGFRCSDVDQAKGYAAGRCSIEAARREKMIADGLRDMEFVEETRRDLLVRLTDQMAEAVLYLQRARAWQLLTYGMYASTPVGVAEWARSPELRAAERYIAAADLRVYRRYRALRPLLREAAAKKQACRMWLAHVAAEKAMKEANPRHGEYLRLDDYRPPATPPPAVSSESTA